MKLTLIILGSVLAVLAIVAGINYLLQRRRQQKAEAEGIVVYATVVSAEPVGGWLKQLDMKKIVLRVQEPEATTPREVTLRSRTQPGQNITAGVRLIVVIDPANAERIYPASPEAAKRVVLTGSRQERRLMQSQLRNPRAAQRPPSGYQPPINKIR